MFEQVPILSLIVLSPLLGVIALLFVPGQNGRWIKNVGIAATFVPLVLSAALYADYLNQSDGFEYREQADWIRFALNPGTLGSPITSYIYDFDYHLAVDGLSLPLVFLTALLGTMAAFASVHIKKRWKAYFIFFLLLELGMLGVFMARDLFLFFLFFEATLVPTFFLIGIWGYAEREKAANKFLIYNGLGSAVMLIAFFILISTAGAVQTASGGGSAIVYSGDLGVIMNNLLMERSALVNVPTNPFFLGGTAQWAVFILLLVAFGIKLPMFPFHTWMLKVHAEAPPSLVMLHSGVMLKMGAYGLLRFGILLFPAQAKQWALVLAALGVINILYGALLAFVQKDFKLVLAYSSVSHMGVVLLGLAAFNQTGMQGAIFQMVSHGLISALMFLIVGSLYERTETTTLGELGGLAKAIPFMSGVLLAGGMALLGLPGLSGFIGEFMAFLGLFGAAKTAAVIGALGIILAAVYTLRGVLSITFGPMPDKYRDIRDARVAEVIPMIALVAFIVLLGVYPAILNQPLEATVSAFDHLLNNLSVKVGG
jgi:NADH-quinone oxidoreductase subunit M